MKSLKWIGLFTLVGSFFVIGCGGGGGPAAPMVDEDEIARYVVENPGVVNDESLEPEEVEVADPE